ncbi:MAG: hypothetical protein BWK76_04130 [Desulfobulbaceae bacterium A2]|nr:MAG: hypothetical protein BWK76_04130 [Desulfobulbaceae bacterium A2]
MGLTNGSKDGYEKGFRDGLAGRPSNPCGPLDAFKQALHPKNYTETFLDGYHQGWKDGNRKRNGV